MASRVVMCDTSEGGGDLYGNCAEHGRFLYFCPDCHEEWRQANPRTAAAIARFASSGKGSLGAIQEARAADQEATR